MADVIIYSTKVCPYCVKAKMLLTNKKVQFSEVDVSDQAKREDMTKKAGGKKSVPQIFINGQHIGGCDDLYELNSQGKLDELLAG